MSAAASLEDLWAEKSSEQLAEALACLSDYTEPAQAVIRAEGVRRGLPPPLPSSLSRDLETRVSSLYRWYVRCVALQWVIVITIIIGPAFLYSRLGSPLLMAMVLLFLASVIVSPIVGSRLMALVGGELRRGTWLAMAMPLFNLLSVIGMRPLVDRWRRLHGVEP